MFLKTDFIQLYFVFFDSLLLSIGIFFTGWKIWNISHYFQHELILEMFYWHQRNGKRWEEVHLKLTSTGPTTDGNVKLSQMSLISIFNFFTNHLNYTWITFGNVEENPTVWCCQLQRYKWYLLSQLRQFRGLLRWDQVKPGLGLSGWVWETGAALCCSSQLSLFQTESTVKMVWMIFWCLIDIKWQYWQN